MECERIRASAVWKTPAAYLRPEAALLPRDDGGYTGGSQAHHYYAHTHHHHHQPLSSELLEGCVYKGYGGGDDFSVDDLLDLGDGGGAADEAAENTAGCEGGAWGKGAAGSNTHSDSGLTSEAGVTDAEPLVPQVGDITDLEWVSQFVDDSYGYVPPCPVISPAYAVTKAAAAAASKHEPQQRPLQFVPNPTSGASHSRSPSAGSVASITSPVAGVCSLSLKRPWSSTLALEEQPLGGIAAVTQCRRARTKRPRTSGGARAWALSAGSLLQEPLCSSASSTSSCSSTSSSFSSRAAFEHGYAGGGPYDFILAPPSQPRPRGRPPLHKKKHASAFLQGCSDPLQLLLQRERHMRQKKKKGRKPKPAPSFGFTALPSPGSTVPADMPDEGGAPGTGRRCSHCGVQKTPQWRAGPMGAKTLCNACGVRYKSGRLLPEYRPACSPTFVSHVHSNSHRKVLEMRRNKELLMVQHQPAPQPQPQRQALQQEQLLVLSASAVAAAAVASPQPMVTAQSMPAQQMVC